MHVLYNTAELIQESGYSFPADVWSLGCTLIELADGEPPYADVHPMRALFMIPNKPPPTVRAPDAWSKDFNDFLRQCLQKDPERRTKVRVLLEHPFCAEAAKRLKDNGGKSDVLKALVAEHLPTIDAARQEDAEMLEEDAEEDEEGGGAGDGEAARGGAGGLGQEVAADGTMKVGTLRSKLATLRGKTIKYADGTVI